MIIGSQQIIDAITLSNGANKKMNVDNRMQKKS